MDARLVAERRHAPRETEEKWKRNEKYWKKKKKKKKREREKFPSRDVDGCKNGCRRPEMTEQPPETAQRCRDVIQSSSLGAAILADVFNVPSYLKRKN